MKPTVVLYPFLGIGHLNPAVELANLLIRDGFDVVIILIHSPFDTAYSSTISSFISRVSASHPSISFHRLPSLSLPPPSSSNHLLLLFDLLRRNNPPLLDFLSQLSKTNPIRAVVLDFFCVAALDVAAELRIPSYFFFCPSASSLCACLSLSETRLPLKNSGDDDALLDLPGLPPIPASHVPSTMRNPEDEAYAEFASIFTRMKEADGIIVNTFRSLEARAVSALADRRLPPVYCIGPLVATGRETHACLTWLDSQPKGSVVFLCFGSMGTFPAEQINEIAIGLERSGQRFVWVVRHPTKTLEELMPEGFLERTEGRGMVVMSWAPQMAVLEHEAVGGFVSHCGWNSVLEAVIAGVALIAWPLYAEQRLNKVFLVEAAKLAVGMQGYDEELVSAAEVERKIRWLMESEGGRELKERAAAMKESAVAARKDGGTSEMARMELVSALRKQ